MDWLTTPTIGPSEDTGADTGTGADTVVNTGTLPAAGSAWAAFLPCVEAELEGYFTTECERAATISPGFPLMWERLRQSTVGGKLMRPRLVHLAWRAFSRPSSAPSREGRQRLLHAQGSPRTTPQDERSCARLAAAFELLHAALLVHDDVVDRDSMRRGRPTVGELYRRDVATEVPGGEAEHAGLSAAVIAGDLLLTSALRLATTCTTDVERSRAVADVVFTAVTASAAGELEDLLLSLQRYRQDHPDVQRILDMQHLKTATYSFEAPLRAGALLAGASTAQAGRLAAAGARLGVAYQVVDDVLGTFGDTSVTGKSVDSDLRDGKATVLTAHGHSCPDSRAALRRLARGAGSVQEVRSALDGDGAEAYAIGVAAELVDEAREQLAALQLPAEEAAELESICHHVLQRRS